MLAHIHVKVVKVLNRAPQLLETFDLARLIPLIENLEDLLDELQCWLDLGEFRHGAGKAADVRKQLRYDRHKLLTLQLNYLVHDDRLLFGTNAFLFD